MPVTADLGREHLRHKEKMRECLLAMGVKGHESCANTQGLRKSVCVDTKNACRQHFSDLCKFGAVTVRRANPRGGETPPPVLTKSFVVVDIDPLQLQVTVSMVTAIGADSMLITDDLPELEMNRSSRRSMGLTSLCHGNSCATAVGLQVSRGDKSCLPSLHIGIPRRLVLIKWET